MYYSLDLINDLSFLFFTYKIYIAVFQRYSQKM